MELIYVDTPLLVPMPFNRRYRLERALEVKWRWKGEEKSLVVEAGYLTDGASIPRPFWSLIGSPYLPEFIAGALVHDKMCDLKWDVEEMSDLFLEILKVNCAGNSKAELMRDVVYAYKMYVSK